MRAVTPDVTGRADRDGTDIAYEVYESEGPTLLLIPPAARRPFAITIRPTRSTTPTSRVSGSNCPPGVNAGIIPTNDGLACVFAGRPQRLMPAFSSDPEGEFLRLLRQAGMDLLDRVSAGSRVTPFRGTPGLPGFIRQAHGPGWALVGDAGYTKDPISAHGISDALRDAELCATAVDRALRLPAEEKEAMTDFQMVRDRLSSAMFTESQPLAGFDWGPAEASQRMRTISDAVREECALLSGLPALPAPAMV